MLNAANRTRATNNRTPHRSRLRSEEMRRFTLSLWILVAAATFVLPAGANVKPNGMFTDNAVLQQGMPVRVWGDAKSGEKVTVQFQGQTQSTTAKDGRWKVVLRPLKAGGPFDMTIEGENTVQI